MNKEDFLKTTISYVRTLVHDKWPHVSSGPSELRLLFAGKQLKDKLNDGNDATLEDHNIQRNSTLQLVFRLPGGMEHPNSNFTERVPTPRMEGKSPQS